MLSFHSLCCQAQNSQLDLPIPFALTHPGVFCTLHLREVAAVTASYLDLHDSFSQDGVVIVFVAVATVDLQPRLRALTLEAQFSAPASVSMVAGALLNGCTLQQMYGK